MLETPFHIWVIFSVVIVAAIVIDFAVFHRKPHAVGLREAFWQTAGWIALAMAFNVWIYLSRGPQRGLEFLTGYVVEQSLSLDNVFVFLLVFQAFHIKPSSQHKVLYGGIAGALFLRAAFVLVGVTLIGRFHFIFYVFGAILLVTGVKMILSGERHIHPEDNWMVRLARKVVPVSTEYEGEQFWVNRSGRWNATPLLLALVAIEALDIVFAVDSVSAVLAITRDSFIAYSSNVFAILGLRSMYFGLAGVLPRFRFLHQGLAIILVFIGGKMLLSETLPLSTGLSLGILAAILILTMAASILWPRRKVQPS